MSDPAAAPQIHELSVCTFLDSEKIVQAIEDDYLEFTENVTWTRAKQMLNELHGDDVSLPVILVDSTSEQSRVMAWGVARSITIEGRRTHVRLENIGYIPSWPVVDSLVCERTGKPLSESDQRTYQIIETPSFIFEEPRTYVLTWKPNRKATIGDSGVPVPVETFAGWRSQILDGLIPIDKQWSCYSVKKVCAGDRYIMLRTGDAPRGIVGWGWIRSNGRQDGWKHVDILWQWVFDPDEPLDLQSLPGMESFRAPQGSGVELDSRFHDIVWQAVERLEDEDRRSNEDTSKSDSTLSPSLPQPTLSSPSPELAEDTASSLEGRLIETWSTRRERDAKNRALCLEVHKYRCVVCKMSFLEEYGEIGRDFIHVHHEHPLASSDAENGSIHVPASDMKPVCPNCHAMLHRGMNAQRGEVRSIAELRSIRAQEKAAEE